MEINGRVLTTRWQTISIIQEHLQQLQKLLKINEKYKLLENFIKQNLFEIHRRQRHIKYIQFENTYKTKQNKFKRKKIRNTKHRWHTIKILEVNSLLIIVIDFI